MVEGGFYDKKMIDINHWCLKNSEALYKISKFCVKFCEVLFNIWMLLSLTIGYEIALSKGSHENPKFWVLSNRLAFFKAQIGYRIMGNYKKIYNILGKIAKFFKNKIDFFKKYTNFFCVEICSRIFFIWHFPIHMFAIFRSNFTIC